MSKSERQKREKKIWDEHIQPLIEEYGLDHFKYVYMEWDPKWMYTGSSGFFEHKQGPLALRLVHGHLDFETSFMKKDKTYHHGTLDLIDWLKKRAHEEIELPCFERSDGRIDYPRISPEDLLPIFKTHMRLHFEEKTLPYLLEQIDKKYGDSGRS
jgi:hypothetical protein